MSGLGGPLDLLVGLAAVLTGSVAYAYSFESLASRARLGQGLAGGVVSPLLTSVPELAVLLASIVEFRGAGGLGVAEGTVVGEPLVIATVALPASIALTGGLNVDRSVSRPYLAFAALFPLVLAPRLLGGLLPRAGAASCLVASYVALALAWRSGGEEVPERSTPVKVSAPLLVASVASFAYGSRLLVAGVLWAAGELGVTAAAASSLLVPAATALPEALAALAWARRGLGTMAASALIGEQVLYATVYPAVGMLAAPWPASPDVIAAVAATEAAVLASAAGAMRGRLGGAQAWAGVASIAAYLAFLGLER